MNPNVGDKEQMVRMVGGVAALMGAMMVRSNALRIPLALAGLMGLTTAMTRYCPVNKALGIDTRSHKERARDVTRRRVGKPKETLAGGIEHVREGAKEAMAQIREGAEI